MTEPKKIEEDDKGALSDHDQQPPWRRLSRHSITELRATFHKRQQSVYQSSEEFLNMESDDDTTPVSSREEEEEEYRRKKMLEAELKLSVLDGMDTVSESSSLTNSLCFQDPDAGDVNDVISVASHANSHNSDEDGLSDGESASYSNSFVESIDEEIESFSSSDENETKTVSSQLTQTEAGHKNVDISSQLTQCDEASHKNVDTSSQLTQTEASHQNIHTSNQFTQSEASHKNIDTSNQLSQTEARHSNIDTSNQLSQTEARHSNIDTSNQLSQTEARHKNIDTSNQLSQCEEESHGNIDIASQLTQWGASQDLIPDTFDLKGSHVDCDNEKICDEPNFYEEMSVGANSIWATTQLLPYVCDDSEECGQSSGADKESNCTEDVECTMTHCMENVSDIIGDQNDVQPIEETGQEIDFWSLGASNMDDRYDADLIQRLECVGSASYHSMVTDATDLEAVTVINDSEYKAIEEIKTSNDMMVRKTEIDTKCQEKLDDSGLYTVSDFFDSLENARDNDDADLEQLDRLCIQKLRDSLFQENVSFQNISCNKGPASSEPVCTDQQNSSTTSVTRRQLFLMDTVNKPLQACIQKARLVASIKECIDNANTSKDKSIENRAYKEAVQEFAEAVDSLVVEEHKEQNKEAGESPPDKTYSLDDSNLQEKRSSSIVDIFGTPVPRKRLVVQQQIHYNGDKDELLIVGAHGENEEKRSMVDNAKDELEKSMMGFTFATNPDKSERCMPSNTEMVTVGSKNQTQEVTNDDTYKIVKLNELSIVHEESINNDDTAYGSDLDLSSLVEANKTYIKNSGVGITNILSVDKPNAGTYKVRKIDKNIDGAQDEPEDAQLSENETLNFVASMCNIDDFLHPDDCVMDHDQGGRSQSQKDEKIMDASHEAALSADMLVTPRRNVSKENQQLDENECDIAKLMDEVKELTATRKKAKWMTPNVSPELAYYEIDRRNDIVCEYCEQTESEQSENKRQTVQDANLFETTNVILHQDCSPQRSHHGICKNGKLTRTEMKGTYDDEMFQNDVVNDNKEEVKMGDSVDNDAYNQELSPISRKRVPKPEMSREERLDNNNMLVNESLSITSSTSGEYTLPLQGRMLQDDLTPTGQCTGDLKQEVRPDQCLPSHPNDGNFHFEFPPNELLIREKSADTVEVVHVENPETFQQFKDNFSLALIKNPGQKGGNGETPRGIPDERSDVLFDNSISYLRKTASECLGRLREKVAFFESMERTFQGSVNISKMSDIPDHNMDSSALQPSAFQQFHSDKDLFKPVEMNSDITPNQNLTVEEKSTSTLASEVQDEEVQVGGPLDACIGPDDTSKEAIASLVDLTHDLKDQVSKTNQFVENVQCFIQENFQDASQERRLVKDCMDALNTRVNSHETLIIEKLSKVEESMCSQQKWESTLEKIQETMDKMGCESADNSTHLKHLASDIVQECKQNVEASVQKLTTDFKEQFHSMHKILNELQESKSDASALSSDEAASARDNENELKVRVVELKNQRDAEKMYHKITRESMRALERDHDRLRHEMLLAASRRRPQDVTRRRSSSHLQILRNETLQSEKTDLDAYPFTSTPIVLKDSQHTPKIKGSLRPKANGTDAPRRDANSKRTPLLEGERRPKQRSGSQNRKKDSLTPSL